MSSRVVLLVDKVQGELVLVGADLVTDAALPRAGQSVQWRVQEVHSSLKEQDAAVLTAEQSTLTHVVRQHVVQWREPGHWLRVLDRLVLGRLHRHWRQLRRGPHHHTAHARGGRVTWPCQIGREWRHEVCEGWQLVMLLLLLLLLVVLSLGEHLVNAGQQVSWWRVVVLMLMVTRRRPRRQRRRRFAADEPCRRRRTCPTHHSQLYSHTTAQSSVTPKQLNAAITPTHCHVTPSLFHCYI